MNVLTALFVMSLTVIQPVSAQLVTQAKPPLFFREDWKESPAETPITQAHVNTDGLTLGLHGPGKSMLKKSNHEKPLDDPFYIWSGQCEDGNWAVTLTPRGKTVDLSNGVIGWRTKNFDRVLYVLVELENGNWLVSARGTGETPGWHEFSIDLSTMAWKTLNIATVTAGDSVNEPDLSRVKSVGFTDLENGGMSASCTRIDWIEVYGRTVQP